MTTFLHDRDKNFELKFIKKIFFVVSAYLFLFSIFALSNNAYYSFLINLLLSCSFIVMYAFVKLRMLNLCLGFIFLSVIIYSSSSIYFFGYDLGFEYCILPAIAYSHLLYFEKKYKTIVLGVLGLIYFYLIIYLFYINDYSLRMPLELFSINIDFYIKIFQIIFVGTIFVSASYTIRRMRKEEITIKQYLHSELDKNVSLDYLTGLKNRWYFMDAIEDVNIKNEVNFALIDIDYFKKINDAYGHLIGDEVLKTCSNLMQKYFSSHTDMICRWGGEEFLIFTHNVRQIDFLKICENFRREFEKTTFSNPKLKATVSIGTLYVNNNFSSSLIDEYVKQVDECLYSAKNNGRNKIVKNTF